MIDRLLSLYPAVKSIALHLSWTFSNCCSMSLPSFRLKRNIKGTAPLIWIPTIAIIHSGVLSDPRATISPFSIPSFINPCAKIFAFWYISVNVTCSFSKFSQLMYIWTTAFSSLCECRRIVAGITWYTEPPQVHHSVNSCSQSSHPLLFSFRKFPGFTEKKEIHLLKWNPNSFKHGNP